MRVGSLPADRRLPRPVAADLRAGRGRARGRRAHLHPHPRDGHRRRRRPGPRACETEWGDVECEVVVIAGGMYAAELGRLAGVRVPIVPMAHEYLVTQPFRERASRRRTCRRCATPTTSSTSARRATGWSWAATSATCAPWSLDERPRRPHPAGLQRAPARGGLAALRGDRRDVAAARARRWRTSRSPGSSTAPRRSPPTTSSASGETEVDGLFVAAGLLRARPGRRGRDRQGHGRVDRRRRAADRPLAHGHPALRPAVPLAALHAGPHPRGLRDLLRHPLPGPGAPGRPAAEGLAAPTRGTATTAPSSARSPAGSGSTGTRPTRRDGRRRRCARAAGRASTGRRRSAPSTPPRASAPRCSTSRRSPSSRSSGPGAARVPRDGCATTASPATSGAITYTQMLNARGGIECDFTVTRLADDAFQIVTGTAFGTHDLAWIRRHAPRDGSVRVARHHRRAGPASRCGARAPATSSRR